jgi:hypothetical protein
MLVMTMKSLHQVNFLVQVQMLEVLELALLDYQSRLVVKVIRKALL